MAGTINADSVRDFIALSYKSAEQMYRDPNARAHFTTAKNLLSRLYFNFDTQDMLATVIKMVTLLQSAFFQYVMASTNNAIIAVVMLLVAVYAVYSSMRAALRMVTFFVYNAFRLLALVATVSALMSVGSYLNQDMDADRGL
ncbi:hypothetical protein RI367_001826 [Sorochytrium milnesiophthora]